MPNAWDNGGEPVEFDYAGEEYRVYGTVNADGDARARRIEANTEWPQGWLIYGFTIGSTIAAAAREALERAWWEQLDWREKRKITNREG
jgi:hypothetical protein